MSLPEGHMASASKQFQLKGLREQRAKIKGQIEKIGDAMRKEERAMTPEEKSAFDKLKTDFAAVSESIRVAEKDMAELDAAIAGSDEPATAEPAADPAMDGGANSRRVPGREDRSHAPRNNDGGPAYTADDLRLARQAWARAQYKVPLKRQHVEACRRVGLNPRAKELVLRIGDPLTRARRFQQQRALTVTTTAGGYLIAEDYSYELEQKMVDFSNVRGIVREVQTATGADLPWPTEDDTSNEGELLGVNAEAAFADPTFASVTFGAYKFSSKGVLVPNELIEDAAFDVDSMVFGEIGTRIGRKQGEYFTTGSGSSQPKGIVTCASAGVTTASATAFTADELVRLAHSVDPAYRSQPGTGYMMKDDVIAYCLLLKDGVGRPLLRENYAQNTTFTPGQAAFMIGAFPVWANQKMTGLTSNAPVSATKHVLFGCMQKFIVRDVGTVRVRRLDERYAEKDQVGFIGFARADSNCVNTAAIKYLLQA